MVWNESAGAAVDAKPAFRVAVPAVSRALALAANVGTAAVCLGVFLVSIAKRIGQVALARWLVL